MWPPVLAVISLPCRVIVPMDDAVQVMLTPLAWIKTIAIPLPPVVVRAFVTSGFPFGVLTGVDEASRTRLLVPPPAAAA